MLFVDAPTVLLVTFTIIVQPPDGIEVPLAMVKLLAPAVAVTPGQLPELPAVLIVMPTGKASVKMLESVIAPALLLPIVTVRFVLLPLLMFVEAKVWVIEGEIVIATGPATVPVSAVGPVAMGVPVVLFIALVAVTLWVIVQFPPGTMMPSVKPAVVPRSLPPLSTALPAPLQMTPPAALFTRVPLYVSVMLTPVMSPGLLPGFVTVITMLDVPPDAIIAGVNVLVTVGAA